MSNKSFITWNQSETQTKGNPKGENKEKYVATKEQNGFFFSEITHM